MAIYRMTIKIVTRSKGHSICAKAAYNASDKVRDFHYGKTHDYTRKPNTVHTNILTSIGTPEWADDREALWNRVEDRETYGQGVDPARAQLARNIELSLPRELTRDQQIALTERYLYDEYVSKGMVADYAIHNTKASDGGENPHVHILLTMRRLDSNDKNGFGGKERGWNPTFTKGDIVKDKDMIIITRGVWQDYANDALALAGRRERIDSRSYADRGLSSKAEPRLGAAKLQHIKSPEAQAKRDLHRRTRWMNDQMRHVDKGRWVDPEKEKSEAQWQAEQYYGLRRNQALEDEQRDFYGQVPENTSRDLYGPEISKIISPARGREPDNDIEHDF